MPRPKTKQELLNLSQSNYNKLQELIDMFEPQQQQVEYNFDNNRDKTLRDIIVHLYEWHQLILTWIKKNSTGDLAKFLPEQYNGKTYREMNVEFWKKHQTTDFLDGRERLDRSHKDVMNLIGGFTNEELFIKKYFDGTGTTSLGSYCVSATSSHYDWVIKLIKKAKK